MIGGQDPGSGKAVAVIGAGRVGTAVAYVLASRGYNIAAVYSRNAADMERAAELARATPVKDAVEAVQLADIVLITTPDDAVKAVCQAIASSRADLSGKKFVHMSGALSLDVLGAAAARGADILSVHPLQTFADLQGALDSLPGSAFGVTCAPELQPWARAFVEDLEGRPVMVRDSDRALYHAAAVLACNLVVMIEHGALTLYRGLGIEEREALDAFMPLVHATVENIHRLGPVDALTGPLARGDVGTVRANLDVLSGAFPELAELYRAVSIWGLRLVEERGVVDDRIVEEMRRLLEGYGLKGADRAGG